MNLTRRGWLTTTVGVGVTCSVSGCVGGNETNATEIEYRFGDTIPFVETPEWIDGTHNRRTGNENWTWIVIEFEVTRGSVDTADLFTYAEVEVDTSRDPVRHKARVIRLLSPEEQVIYFNDDGYEMGDGTQGEAYYLLAGEPADSRLITHRLEEHRDVGATER